MIRAVRRRFTVYRIYRQNRALWDAYLFALGTSADPLSTEVLEALDSFLLEFISSYDRLSQPKLLHRFFGESFLPAVVDALIQLIAEHGTVLVNEGCDGLKLSRSRSVIERTLIVCSIILQDPVYSSQVAFNLPLTTQILSLLESIEDKELKTLVLQLISGICSNHESRLEIARLEGFRKILDLLNHGDESLSHQILRTLRIFLDAESDNQNIFSDRRPSLEIRTRAASPNSFLVSASNANTSSSAEKAGTWSRLRSSQPEKPPQIVRSKSLINLGITHFVSFPSEFGIFSLQNNTADDEEPANDERQELFEHRDSVIPINRNVVSKQKQQFSELNNSALSVSTTSIVKTLLTTQGALEQLSRSLQESHLEMQLELLQTISTLIMRNNASQREFARIKGYSSVTRLLLQAVHDLPESKCHDFLAECFGIISTIILDGDPQNLISNLSAFSWLMTEISPAGLLAHSPVMAYVADFLNELLIGNPLNSAAFVEHIQNLVCSYSSSHVSARRRVMNLLLNLDILLCLYTNAVLDGLIQLWASPFDCDLFDCTLKLLQNRNLHQAPRSSETMQLITSIGKHLSDGSVSVSDRNSLIHLLIIAAISGESYSSSPNSDPEFSSSCVDLEEAMDILYMTVISRWPEKELALYFLGYLSSIWSCWSALNLSRLGHHADTQLNNCGLRLLFRLLEIPNVDAKYVMIVISSFLLGLFGDEDISRFQREFAFTGGFQVFINYLLLHKENFDMLASGVFALMAAILNNPTNKLTLECEPKLDQLLNVLILHEEFASTKYNFFAFVFELATECENDSKQEFLNIPKAMRPSDNAMQAIFAISQWRESSLLSQRPKPSISLSKEYDDSLFWQKRACKPPANSGEGSEDYPVMQSTETRLFRVGSVIPLQCIKICVSVKSPEAQAAMLLSILQAIKGQPHNKLILTEIDALSFLLRSWKNFMLYSLDVRDSFFSLISCLGRYSIQPNQVRLLFDLAYCAMSSSDGNTESYILDMIAAIAARITPETYFSFKNPTSTCAPFVSSTFTRTPVSRTGYSVVFWFRISRYCNEETSLFTWVQNDAPMYEVLLRLTPRPCGDNDRSVCIRCLNLGTFMFDKQETITEHEWHHFVLTHTRSGVAITIDSVMIGKYPAIPYPSTIIKRDSFHLIIGGSNLVGQIGSVSVIEGCLDHSQVQLYFDQGPSPSLFSDAKLLLKVQAEDFVEPGYRNSISSPVALASRALSGSSILSSDNRVSLPSNVVPHHTMSLRTAFSSPGVGGFSLCIPFIGENRSESNGARLTALRILSELISQSAGGMAEFERQRGFEMLCYCLTPCHLSMEVFNVLLDITRKHSSCFAIIMELLRHSTGPGTRSKVLGILADMVRDESLLCITGSGLMGLLELLSISAQIDEPAVPTDLTTPSPSLLSSVLSIIEHVLMTSNIVNDFEIIIAFIACKHEHCELLSEERAAMISLFCCCSEKRESLLSSISFPLVIKMLESTSTNARVQCLRLLALLFRNSPKNKSHFVKIHGFDAVLRLLAKHQPVNEKICDAIFDLALDRYNAPSKVSGGPSSSLDDRPNAIVHPEAIRLLLELLRLASSRPTLHLRYIERLDELIESRPNLSILLAEPWLHWCRQYLEGIGRFQSVERLPSHLCQQEPQYVNDTDSVSTSSVLSSTRGENGERHRARLVSRFVRLIQKIAIRDLSWHTGRSSCLPALLLMVEASEFVSLVVDRILHHFEKRPRLDESEAYCLIRNLSRIIESIDELCGAGEKPISGKWSVRLIHLINLLASQNNGDIRLRMKQSGLFELRDQLLLRFCRQPCSPSDRFVALSQLSLDAVASDTKFRSSDGILYLFRWFVCDEDHAQLRSLLVDVLRNRLGQHLEARKDLERAVGDPDILHRLLESSMSDSEFIIWFFAEEQNAQRQMLLSRLEKSLQISEIYARKQLEKIEERRQKRIRSRLDSLGKAAAASERDVQDFLEKCEITVSRFSKLIATQTELAADARLARLELGASVYANQCRNFNGNLGCNYEDSPSSSRFCYICSIEFESEWNAICHLRLDHWLCDVQAKSTRSVRDGCVSPLQS